MDHVTDEGELIALTRQRVEGAARRVARMDRTYDAWNPAAMLGPEFVKRVQTVAPHVRIRFAVPDKERMRALLENAEIDIFIGSRGGADKAWLSRALFEDEFVTAQRKGHPRGNEALDLNAFCSLPHLLVASEGDPFSGSIDKALEELGLSRHAALSLQSYAVAPTIVAGSDLICTLPGRLLKPFAASLDLFEPPLDLAALQIVAYWHLRQQDDPAHQWLRGQLFAAATHTKP